MPLSRNGDKMENDFHYSYTRKVSDVRLSEREVRKPVSDLTRSTCPGSVTGEKVNGKLGQVDYCSCIKKAVRYVQHLNLLQSKGFLEMLIPA